MLQTTAIASAYKIHEYLLVLSPTGEANRQIWSIKREFNRTLGTSFAVHTGPHLSVVVFLAYAGKEETIVNRLLMIGEGITPFNIVLQDFGCFDGSRTIYINVITKTSLQNVVEELKQAKHLLKLNVGFAPRFVSTPHVTICRGMQPSQYNQGWSKYSKLSFNGNFTAASMTLLRRTPNEHACKSVTQIPFLSAPTMPRQGILFG